MPLRVGLNGAGRIGRALLRRTLRNPDVEIAGINDLAGPATIAHLLRYDSLHGAFPCPVLPAADRIVIDGRAIPFSAEAAPERIPWHDGVDVVVEATGRFATADLARAHLHGSVRRVVVSAVCPGADATVVLGLHDGTVGNAAAIVSTASCTTHAAALPLALLDEWYGVTAADMTTVHCTTGSQVTIDAPHADLRRARAALVSMIPTTTSAQQGLVAALPFLDGRLACLAVRVPTATVSLVEVVAQTARPADDVATLAERFRAAAAAPPYAGRLAASDEPLVSIDFNGNQHSSVVDLPLLARPGRTLVRVVAWYDNEYGYAARLAELLSHWSRGRASRGRFEMETGT